ncbi:MAG TPA: hypothetical protein VMT73_13555 [Anaerolineales bacterium]|nr:hypothetical protein [Anaerolineales bacterium]
MDPITLAASVTTLLAPYLAKAGQALADKAVAKLPDAAGKLWNRIFEKFQSKPAAQDAANDLIKDAGDKDNQSAFETQLRKILKEDPAFLEELSSLAENAKKEAISLQGSGAIATNGGVAAGQGGVAVGGNVQGNIIVGNNNTVKNDSK